MTYYLQVIAISKNIDVIDSAEEINCLACSRAFDKASDEEGLRRFKLMFAHQIRSYKPKIRNHLTLEVRRI